MIDGEIVSVVRRWARRFQVDEDTLAVQAIRRVGPRGHFLYDDHALQHLRTGELISTELFERSKRDAWVTKGGKSLEQKAREKAFSLLETHEVEPLPADVASELQIIVDRADVSFGG